MEGALKLKKAGDDNVKLVRTMEDGKGGNRGRWEGTFRVLKAERIGSRGRRRRRGRRLICWICE